MRDLVEFVIDGLLQQEKMQQQNKPASDPQAGTTFSNVLAKVPDHAQLHTVGPQTPASTKERDADLWKVSLQFEAIFVQQMMSEMRKTISKSDFMPGGFAEDMHASMMDEAIAKVSGQRSTFGIADNIYRQLAATQNTTTKTDSKQIATKQTLSTQDIANTADTLQMNRNLAMEVGKYAH